MTEQLHPSLDEIIPSVVRVIFRRYRNFVERDDLIQEAKMFCLNKVTVHSQQLSVEDSEERVRNEKRIGWQIRRHLERYCRREKANKSGYQINDEMFYETFTISQLLTYVIKSIVNDTALEQAQNMINDGTPRKPAAPSEGGNLLAFLIDIKKGYQLLDQEDQDILRLRYHEGKTLQNIAEYLECAISTADRRCSQALAKLQEKIGGQSPYG